MNTILKLVFPIALLLVSCKTKEEPITPSKGVSREQVVAIATKYGLQDSIAEGYVSPHFKPFPPEAYPALTEEFWDKYFAHWRRFADNQKEFAQFRKETSNITSMAEYYQLIEQYPSLYEQRVQAMGGLDAYNQQKSEDIATKMHIYLQDDGSLTFIPAGSDNGMPRGKRLDKLR